MLSDCFRGFLSRNGRGLIPILCFQLLFEFFILLFKRSQLLFKHGQLGLPPLSGLSGTFAVLKKPKRE